MTDDKPKKLRGFAALKARDPERQKELARKGGASLPASQRPYAKDWNLAVASGRKGAEARKKKEQSDG